MFQKKNRHIGDIIIFFLTFVIAQWGFVNAQSTWTDDFSASNMGGWTLQISDRYTALKGIGYILNTCGGNAGLYDVKYYGGSNNIFGNSWYGEWYNSGCSYLDTYYGANGWHIGSEDGYVSMKGGRDASGVDTCYLFAVNSSTSWAMVLMPDIDRFYNNSYYQGLVGVWGNNGNGWVNGWHLDQNDRRTSGCFDASWTGDELFTANPVSGWASIMKYRNGTWTTLWSNSGNGYIGEKGISGTDYYMANDFDGDGVDELLCINYYTGYAWLLKYSDSGWTTVWNNGGNSMIGNWSMSSMNCTYGAGHLSTPSIADLFAKNGGSAMVLRYNGGSWGTLWSNGGSGYINGWNITVNDRVLVSKLVFLSNIDGRDRLILINPYTSSSLVTKFTPQTSVSGTISSNDSWSGTVNVTGNVTINSGITLNIYAGTSVICSPGVTVTSNGVLKIVGTSSYPVTFTSSSGTVAGSWGSIVLNGSGASGSNLNNINMQYGTNIQVINGAANVTIQNSTIDNNNGAIVFSNSTGSVINNHIFYSADYHGIQIVNGSNVNCYQNKLKKTNLDHHDQAIIFGGGGTGTAWQNDINYFNWGIGAIWGSSPTFLDPHGYARNNRITNCLVGVEVYENSYPIIGDYSIPGYGGTSIHSNSVDIALNIYHNTVSTLKAMCGYWNNGNPGNAVFQIGSGSSILTYPYPTIDPWLNEPLPSVQAANGTKGQIMASIQSTNTSSQPVVSENAVNADSLLDGIHLRENGKLSEAKNFFVSYLGKHTDDQQAYVELYNCYSNETAGEITKYFENLPKAAAKEQKLLLSYLYLKQGNAKAAKEVNNSILSQHANTAIATMAKLNNFYIALYTENDPQTALTMFTDAQHNSSLPTTVEFDLAKSALKTYVDPKTGKMPYADAKDANDPSVSGAAAIPSVVSLSDNYPNPFNPTTQIQYQLPASARVTLKIFDVLGREVATLVNGMKEAGSYTATFDGSHVASGMYFARMIVNPSGGSKQIVQVKKMLMLK